MSSTGAGAGRGRRRRSPLLAVALALVAAAAVAASLTGFSWYAAAHDDSADFARTRDDVLVAGKQAVQNMNTLDHREVDEGLDRWERSATGALLEEVRGGRRTFAEQVRDAKSVSTATVLGGAVTELDERAGKARVMVALRITVDNAESKPVDKEQRMLGEMTRTPDGWKLSAIDTAQIESSAADDGTGDAGSDDPDAAGD